MPRRSVPSVEAMRGMAKSASTAGAPAPPRLKRMLRALLRGATRRSTARAPPPSSGSVMLAAEPRDEAGDALLDARARRIPEQGARAGDVGAGALHVAGLRGEALQLGAHPERIAQQLHQPRQRPRVALAQVHQLEAAGVRRGVGDGPLDPLHDVVDPGVVAPGGAVAEEGDVAALAEHA